jgi:hypothetical protein
MGVQKPIAVAFAKLVYVYCSQGFYDSILSTYFPE